MACSRHHWKVHEGCAGRTSVSLARTPNHIEKMSDGLLLTAEDITLKARDHVRANPLPRQQPVEVHLAGREVLCPHAYLQHDAPLPKPLLRISIGQTVSGVAPLTQGRKL